MLINLKNTLDYEIIFHPKAEKYLKKLSKKDRKTTNILLNTIKKIHNNPYNSINLKSRTEKEKRVRIGDYRIIFKIVEDKNPPVIEITRIGKRTSVYKK